MKTNKKLFIAITTSVIIIASIIAYKQLQTTASFQLGKLDTWNYIQLDKIIQANQLNLLQKSDEKLSVILTVNSVNKASKDFPQLGIVPRTISGSIITAEIPQRKLKEILSNPSILKVRICEQRHMQSLPLPKQKAKAVIGIVDVGIVLKYEDYLDSQGNSRIAAVWDQTETGMNGPFLSGPTPGKLYTGEELKWYFIQKERRMSPGHGTFVSAIAAGNKPIAINEDIKAALKDTEAPIVLVETTKDEGDLIDAISFIKNQCKIWQLPGVANLSYGTDNGPHDGTSALSQALSNMVDSHFLIVTSAGNDNQSDMHIQLENNDVSELNFFIEGANKTNKVFTDKGVALSGWYAKNQRNMEISLFDPSGEKYGPVSTGSWHEWNTAFGSITIANGISNYYENKREIQIVILSTKPNESLEGNWRISLGYKAKGDMNADFWVVSNHGYQCRFIKQLKENDSTLSDIDSTKNIIVVGGYITNDQRKEYLQAEASSRGIINDNQFKPDIYAPWSVGVTNNENQMTSVAGTSFSAPFITRVIEYIWDKHPSITSNEIYNYLHGKLLVFNEKYACRIDTGEYKFAPFTWDEMDRYFVEKEDVNNTFAK